MFTVTLVTAIACDTSSAFSAVCLATAVWVVTCGR